MAHNPKVDEVLNGLFPNGHGLFLAYDQGFEHGPADFSGENADPAFIMKLAASGYYDGVIVHQGIAEQYYEPYRDKVKLILKLNGKTSLSQDEPLSLAVATVDEAVSLGASAVGYTVYVGSEKEAAMLAEFGRIVEEAHGKGLPVFGWMYPRGKDVADPKDPDTIAYAARVGLEVGADVVKIYYPGSEENLKRIVGLTGKTRVVVAGGMKTEPGNFIDQAGRVLAAGASGIAVGRNVWQADDPETISAELRKVVKG